MKSIRNLSLEPSDWRKAIRNASNNKYLPPNSLVLPGEQIFDIFFDATKGEDINSEGE